MDHSFNIQAARKYGVEGATILQCLHCLIRQNESNGKHFHEGRTWTYNSTSAFVQIFPYWTEKQIRRIINNLIDDGAIITGNYNPTPYDRTLWYSMTDEAMSIISETEESNNG